MPTKARALLNLAVEAALHHPSMRPTQTAGGHDSPFELRGQQPLEPAAIAASLEAYFYRLPAQAPVKLLRLTHYLPLI